MVLPDGSAEGLVVVRLLRFFAAIPLASRLVYAPSPFADDRWHLNLLEYIHLNSHLMVVVLCR